MLLLSVSRRVVLMVMASLDRSRMGLGHGNWTRCIVAPRIQSCPNIKYIKHSRPRNLLAENDTARLQSLVAAGGRDMT